MAEGESEGREGWEVAMAKKITVRVLTPGEFLAEGLEDRANKMPPSYKDEAEILRKHARLLRKQPGNRKVRLWEVAEGK